jgi:hypothetical protein
MSKRAKKRYINMLPIQKNDTFEKTKGMRKSIKWRTILALVLVYLATFMNWNWVWGVLFLYWVLPDIFSGVTYFVEPIYKKEHPNLYWVIILSWILLALYSLSTLVIDYTYLFS